MVSKDACDFSHNLANCILNTFAFSMLVLTHAKKCEFIQIYCVEFTAHTTVIYSS